MGGFGQSPPPQRGREEDADARRRRRSRPRSDAVAAAPALLGPFAQALADAPRTSLCGAVPKAPPRAESHPWPLRDDPVSIAWPGRTVQLGLPPQI